jgi:signal transduction histidine kinase
MADLARSVSHDVNNALGSMLPLVQQMAADLRAGRLDTGVFAEDLEHVQKALQVCRRIFGGMLSFSRNAARRSGYGHVRRAIETASAILKYGMGRSGIELNVNIPEEVPEVACSQADLEQVFLNLLTNAVKFTPPGGRVAIDATICGADVRICVTDNGSGIDPEFLPFVFDRFRQGAEREARTEGGLGLGLFIARQLVEGQGGTIRAESSGSGQGSTFIVTLPVTRSARGAQAGAKASTVVQQQV